MNLTQETNFVILKFILNIEVLGNQTRESLLFILETHNAFSTPINLVSLKLLQLYTFLAQFSHADDDKLQLNVDLLVSNLRSEVSRKQVMIISDIQCETIFKRLQY